MPPFGKQLSARLRTAQTYESASVDERVSLNRWKG